MKLILKQEKVEAIISQTEGAVDTIKAFIKVVGRSDLAGAFEIYNNETLLGLISYEGINTKSGSTYDLKGDIQNEIFKFLVNDAYNNLDPKTTSGCRL